MNRLPALLLALTLAPALGAQTFQPAQLTARRDSFVIVVNGRSAGYWTGALTREGENYRLVTDLQGGPAPTPDHHEMVFNASTLMPVSHVFTRTVRGSLLTTRIAVAGGRATGTMERSTPTGPISSPADVAVQAGTIDDEAIPMLLPTLAMTPGLATSFPSLYVTPARVVQNDVSVSAKTMVTVPAGTFEVYRVALQPAGGTPLVMYVTANAPRRAVIIRSGDAEFRLASASATQPAPDIAGGWAGRIDLGTLKPRIVLHIARGADGALKATMDSPDECASGAPVDSVAFAGGALHFEMRRIRATFDGTLDPATAGIRGQFVQGSPRPLELSRSGDTDSHKRPQEPIKPFPYAEEEITYENRQDGVKLAGTLTRPAGAGPFPAVVLITGSGAQNRNEEILCHKMFLVLSDHLTRRGVAVLRVDDRGIGGSTGNLNTATSENLARDVIAGIEFLKQRPEIDAKRIGLVGHSEGGLIAPIVATRTTDAAFIVMMAGPGLAGDEILYLQGAAILRARGASAAALAKQRAVQEVLITAAKKSTDSATAESAAREALSQSALTWTDAERQSLIANARATTTWFRYFVSYDPRPALSKVTVPVLALIGERDLQVPPAENLREIEAALRAGGNKDATVTQLPALNHLFQTSRTGAPDEYGEIEETIAPAALTMIGDWIVSRTRPR